MMTDADIDQLSSLTADLQTAQRVAKFIQEFKLAITPASFVDIICKDAVPNALSNCLGITKIQPIIRNIILAGVNCEMARQHQLIQQAADQIAQLVSPSTSSSQEPAASTPPPQPESAASTQIEFDPAHPGD
jgi:hypothetical protein